MWRSNHRRPRWRHAVIGSFEARQLKLNGVLKHVLVQVQAKVASADRRQLTQHDILRHSLQMVCLSIHGRVKQDIHRFLERAPHHRSRVVSVDAVSCDSHQVPTIRHDITEDSQMPVVHVRAIEGDHITKLLQESVSNCFDT